MQRSVDPGRRSKRRPRGGRLGLVVLAVVGSLVAGELSLQVAARLAQTWVERRGGAILVQGGIRILCVGDSHTFGLPLIEAESYPAQLADALSARHPDLAVQVVNLGVPSLNSAFVANRLEAQIHQLQPQLVIVWVGVNNLWNVVETGSLSINDRGRSLRLTLQASRLFRLASMLWFSVRGHQYDAEQRGGWWDGEANPSGRIPQGDERLKSVPGLARDLERMATLAHGLDTPILFVAYPLAGQQSISRVILEAGARAGVGVIETAPALARAKADGHARAELVDGRAGAHPSGLLYRYVVEAMLPDVERVLSVWHGLPLAVEASPAEPTDSTQKPSRRDTVR